MESERPVSQELIDLKNQQRAALRREYWKQLTNPHTAQTGHVFDPAIQRFMSLRDTKIDYFRETPKSILRGLLLIVLPVVGTIYLFKYDREKKEAAYRSGQVAYKDRLFKFI